jgi:hypothetical protein
VVFGAQAPRGAAAPRAAFDLKADLEALSAAPSEAEVELIMRLADTREPRALRGLLAAYKEGATPYVQRLILRVLPRFDEVQGAAHDALGLLVDVAVGESMRELRDAALDGLASCTKNGKSYLRMIVDSPAEDELRERALKAHLALGSREDRSWYENIYRHGLGIEGLFSAKPKAKSKPKKGAPPEPLEAQPLEALRPLAFDVVAGELPIEEIRKASEDHNATIRVRALEELYLRGEKKIDKLCKDIFEDRTEAPANRLLAGKLALELIGSKYAKSIAKEAVRNITPGDLRDGLAELFAARDDATIRKLVAKNFGKGKSPAKLFYLVAAAGHWEEKFEKPLHSMLGDKDRAVARAAADYAVRERIESAGPALEELYAETEDPLRKSALLPGLARFQPNKAAWAQRLEDLASSPDEPLRNTALELLAGLGQKHLATIVAALDNPLWSTRLTALHALEKLAVPASVGEIVARFPDQTGRMRVEFGKTLFHMTGQTFGPRHQPWRAWWEKEGKSGFKIPSASALKLAQEELEIARLKETTDARFFGIRIISERVIFIIDVSGSMDELTRSRYVNQKGLPRITKAKEELLASLDALNPKSFFNIVPFSGGAYSWRPRMEAWSPETLASAREFVSKLGAGGGTNLIDAMFMALSDPEVDTIFVLSDGEPTAGPITDPKSIRRAVGLTNRSRGVVIHSIAIGTSLKILEWLAEDSGGSYRSFP